MFPLLPACHLGEKNNGWSFAASVADAASGWNVILAQLCNTQWPLHVSQRFIPLAMSRVELPLVYREAFISYRCREVMSQFFFYLNVFLLSLFPVVNSVFCLCRLTWLYVGECSILKIRIKKRIPNWLWFVWIIYILWIWLLTILMF